MSDELRTDASAPCRRTFCVGVAARVCALTVCLIFAGAMSRCDRVAGQEIDEARRNLRSACENVAWENVSDGPQVVHGVRPTRFPLKQFSQVALAPGESTEFLVPRGAIVRVDSVAAERIDDGGTEIWLSNGSGIYRRTSSIALNDGNTLLAAIPDFDVSLAKISRRENATCAIRVAIYVSSKPELRTLDYYECPIQSECQVTVSDDHGTRVKVFSQLNAGKRTRFLLNGASRVRLQARLKFGMDRERYQTFWIRVFVDGNLHRVLAFDTSPESERRMFVDGTEMLLGRIEPAFLDLDCGDRRVEIESSHDCYVRIGGVGLDLARPNLNRQFPYPNWQNVRKAVSLWDAEVFDPGPLLQESTAKSIDSPLLDPYLNWQRILAVARDNRNRHGGLHAYLWLLACASAQPEAATHPGEVTVDDLGTRVRQRYTRFRDCTVDADYSDMNTMSVRSVAFMRRTVRDDVPNALRRHGETRVLAAQHLASDLSAIGQTKLFSLPGDGSGGLKFRPPDGLGASLIRIVVNQSDLPDNVQLMVQYDDGQPQELSVRRGPPVSQDRLEPTAAEASLTAMSSVYGRFHQGTVGGPYAIHRAPLPLVCAGTIELFKPANVDHIRLWASSCDGTSVGVSVQYLDGRRTELSETSYRYLSRLVDAADCDPASHAWATRELDNNSLGLERQLRYLHSQVFSSVSERHWAVPPEQPWSQSRIDRCMQAIHVAESQGDATRTVERYSELIRNSVGSVRDDAILKRVDALLNAGEDYLAEQELRGWMIHATGESLRRRCFDRWLKLAGEDSFKRLRCLAFAAIQWGGEETERQLAQQLANEGRYRDALILLSSLQSDAANEDLVLLCSLQQQWWTTFDGALDRVVEAETKNYWLGLKQWRLGYYDHGRKLLAAGGRRGLAMLEHAERGQQIFTGLSSKDPIDRVESVSQWEDWQSRYPGEEVWESEPSAITAAVATATLVSKVHDATSSGAVAMPAIPVHVEIDGPCRLRIRVRPIHLEGSRQASVDDWIHLEHAGVVRLIPVNENVPSNDLVLQCRQGMLGRSVDTEVELTAGHHRLRVSCENSECLVRVDVKRPRITLPVLPPVNTATLAAIGRGSFGHLNPLKPMPSVGGKPLDCVRFFRRDRRCQTIPLCYKTSPCNCERSSGAFADCDHCAGSIPETFLSFGDRPHSMQIVDRSFVEDHAIALAYRAESNSGDPSADPDGVSRIMALVDIHQMIDEVSQRAAGDRLVEDVEADPFWRDADFTRLLPKLHVLQDRLQKDMVWTFRNEYDQRAGIHTRDVGQWEPESPMLRVRHSLMSHSTGRYLLSRKTPLKLEVNDATPTTFEVVLRQPAIGFLKMNKAQVLVESDVESMLLPIENVDVSQSQRITLPPGRHTLSLVQGDSEPNHFVFAEVYEIGSDGSRREIDHGRFRQSPSQRVYHVATQETPFTFRVPAHQIIRVDRHQDDKITREVVAVSESTLFQFLPEAGEASALFRVFALEYDSGEKLNRSIDAPEELPVRGPSDSEGPREDVWVDDVLAALYPEQEPGIRIGESGPFGDTHDSLLWTFGHDETRLDPPHRVGTKGISLEYRSRFAEEEFPRPSQGDEFWELRHSRMRERSWETRHAQNDLFVRLREVGAPTLGVDHRGTFRFATDRCDCGSGVAGWNEHGRDDWRVDYRGYVMAQFGLEPQPLSGDPSDLWTVGMRLAATREQQLTTHIQQRFSAGLFARSVRDDASSYVPGSIDQDVFTRYKSDHPYGLRISHRLLFQNDLDSRWWMRPTLVGNPDQWVPDYASLQFGTDQLLGPLQMQLSYRMTEYFADNDRSDSRGQHVVYADFLLVKGYSAARWGEWRFSVRSDLTNENTTLGVNVVHFWNERRGLSDFRPGSLLFRSIREERFTKRYLSGS